MQREDVERLARLLDALSGDCAHTDGWEDGGATCTEAAAALRALLAERDAALAAAPQPMGCGLPCGFDCNGACFDAAAPQPAPFVKWPEPKHVPMPGGSELNPQRVDGLLAAIKQELVAGEMLDLADRLYAEVAEDKQQPAPDREALVEVIAKAMLGRSLGGGMVYAIADALLAHGLRLPGDETMAWAVVGEDGALTAINYDRRTARHLCGSGERVVRVAIRVVEGGDDAA